MKYVNRVAVLFYPLLLKGWQKNCPKLHVPGCDTFDICPVSRNSSDLSVRRLSERSLLSVGRAVSDCSNSSFNFFKSLPV